MLVFFSIPSLRMSSYDFGSHRPLETTTEQASEKENGAVRALGIIDIILFFQSVWVLMRPAAVPAFLLVVLATSVLLMTPAPSSGTAASTGDVVLVPYQSEIKISAGSSDSFMIEVVNLLTYDSNDVNNYRMVSVRFDPIENVTVSVSSDERDFVLKGQESRSVTVNVSVDRYAAAKTYSLSIYLDITSLDVLNSTAVSDSRSVDLVIMSPLSSERTFNKILGIFENPLPEPFNTPLASSLITLLLWMVIGLLAIFLLVPFMIRIFAKGRKEEGEKLRRGLLFLLPFVALLFAFDSALRVYGAPEEVIGPVEVWFNVFYIALGAVIAWRLYLIFIQYSISRITKNSRVDQKEMDLEPVLRLFGKLVIWVMSVAMIMAAFGFNLTAIVTSAGIISLGITLGAQNILNQFFSGMVLLLTRPFKSGDLVRIGGSVIYKVSRVNIMNTVFENWDNNETVIMPNNAVSSATIVNLTGDGLIYKITVFMNIAYGDDVDLAKGLMEKAASDHPSVITNGSVDLPSTRLTAFLDSSIEIRLTCYVYDFNDGGKIGGELREAVFKLFKENGISIPFPQRDVHLNVSDKESA